MIELPEAYTISRQIQATLVGKTVADAQAGASPHAFAQYVGDPGDYPDKLRGKRVTAAHPGTKYSCGGNIEIDVQDALLVITTPIRFHEAGAKLPAKHQLLVRFTDGSSMTCTVQMWGSMLCYSPQEIRGLRAQYGEQPPTPLEDGFDEAYFGKLLENTKQTLSVKAFLATEQRIPGLGNGVLQDILFRARLNPRVPLAELSDAQRESLYRCTKETLREMADKGGRDTERDLFGNPGGYRTILSNKTLSSPCPDCLGGLVREAYLGGNIYYCPTCQPFQKKPKGR